MVSVGTICSNVYNGLKQFVSLQISFSASKPYFDKITVHAGEAQLPDFGLPTLQKGITVKDVSFCYDEKKPILVHMNAEFKKGGKYALTGPSGCGKSTLLKILLGWLPDYQGKILFDNRDIRDYTPEQLQQQMSYIEQDVFLFNTTIRENITLANLLPTSRWKKHCVTAPWQATLPICPRVWTRRWARKAVPFRVARNSVWPSPVR